MDRPKPNKPDTMKMREYLINRVAQQTELPKHIVKLIIEEQFRSAREAISDPEIYSIEISGFGKFIFNKKKGVKKLKRYEDLRKQYNSELEKDGLSVTKLNNLVSRIETLNKSENSLIGKMKKALEEL